MSLPGLLPVITCHFHFPVLLYHFTSVDHPSQSPLAKPFSVILASLTFGSEKHNPFRVPVKSLPLYYLFLKLNETTLQAISLFLPNSGKRKKCCKVLNIIDSLLYIANLFFFFFFMFREMRSFYTFQAGLELLDSYLSLLSSGTRGAPYGWTTTLHVLLEHCFLAGGSLSGVLFLSI